MRLLFAALTSHFLLGGPVLADAPLDPNGMALATNRCWNTGSLSTDALKSSVTIEFIPDENGNIDISSVRLAESVGPSESGRNQAFQAARRAIIRCLARHRASAENRQKTVWLRFGSDALISAQEPSKQLDEPIVKRPIHEQVQISNCSVAKTDYSFLEIGRCEATNLTETAISLLSYSRVTKDRNRTVPWSTVDLQRIRISGGIEPGETVEIAVDAGFVPTRASRDTLIIVVEPIAVFDVNENEIH